MKGASNAIRAAAPDEDSSVASPDRHQVRCFPNGAAALDHTAAGGASDVVLADWRSPAEVTFGSGDVEFVLKSRPSIIVERLRLIAQSARPAPGIDGLRADTVTHLGRLELRLDSNRASWAGTPIELTLTEFKMLALLALRVGQDVSYRELYDQVHGKGFMAGYGDEGYRGNVRSFIKRVRKKLRDVDPEFEHIHNCPGIGYRWSDGCPPQAKGRSSERLEERLTAEVDVPRSF